MEIRDAVAVVTGGSSGIGLEAGRALVAAGARVALLARTPGPLEKAARSIGADWFACDVIDRPAVRRTLEEVEKRIGAPSILVNNAAMNARGPVLSRTAEELAQVVETNLVAPMFLTRLVLERMTAPAAIVNVASLAGIVPLVGESAYSASKSGLRAFGAALREELEGQGIVVSTVCPGPVSTPFLLDNLDEVPDLVFSQPMSSAEEVAAAILDCIRHGHREVALPALSGLLSQLGYLFPALRARVTPMLERIGARNKLRYRSRG